MPYVGTVRRPSALSKLFVYVDSYTGHDFGGKLYVYNGAEEIDFDNALDMIKKATEAFDRISFPQAVFQGRSFDESLDVRKNEVMRYSKMEQQSGVAEHEKKATFIIHVKFRQNSTWQGEIKWVNQNKVQYFRSSLEMVKLMDQAVASEFGGAVSVEWD